MVSIKRAFEDSVVELCKTLSSDKLHILDSILTQEKDDPDIIAGIVTEFPNFKDIYAKKLAE